MLPITVHPPGPRVTSSMRPKYFRRIPTSHKVSTHYSINSNPKSYLSLNFRVSDLIIETKSSKSGKGEVLGLIHSEA